MLPEIEALQALAKYGTMTAAATHLRISQPAVSKRIAQLERECGKAVIEAVGRRVRLTPEGARLLERAFPLIAELKDALRAESVATEARLVLGMSESVLSSWGANALVRVRDRCPGLQIEVNAHRSLTILDRVRSGDYMVGVCAGLADQASDLRAETLLEEELAVLPAGGRKDQLPRSGEVEVLGVEAHSATWMAVEKRLARLQKGKRLQFRVGPTLQSYPCIVEMAMSGWAHALAPMPLLVQRKVRSWALYRFPKPGLYRPISVVARPTAFAQPAVQLFLQTLKEVMPEILPEGTYRAPSAETNL